MMSDYKYTLDRTAIFKKDLKKAIKRGCDIKLLTDIIEKLQNGESLPEKTKIML